MADNAADETVVKHIKLRFVGQNSNEIHFRIKFTTLLGKVKRVYANKMKVDVSTLRFVFDGCRVQDDDTPTSLEMEEDDVIDVFQEQSGGSQ